MNGVSVGFMTRSWVERFADMVITLNPERPEKWSLRATRHDDDAVPE
jgi:hypothetical protein